MLKSEITSECNCKPEKPFPKIMRCKLGEGLTNEGMLISFECAGRGQVVFAPSRCTYVVGIQSNAWAMSHFEDWAGSITLTQD